MNPIQNSAAATVLASPLLSSRHFDPNAMTPDALLVYVSTRIGSIDQQMSTVFDRQRQSEKVRNEIRGIQEELTVLTDSAETGAPPTLPEELRTSIATHIEQLKLLEPTLGAAIEKHLNGAGQILSWGDLVYNSAELKNTGEYLSSVSKDLESGAQMDMIELQSFMSSRQTAIQLATNLIAALGETQKSVVANIR